MALSRSVILTASAGVLAAASVASIGYRVWRDFYAPEPAISSAPAPIRTPAPPRQASGSLQSPSRAAMAPAAPGTATPAAPSPPSFDVVRVEPSGDAVVAGRAAPNAKVTLLDNGRPLAQAQTDPSGQFAMTPPTLAGGNHELSLKTAAGGAASRSAQSVTVIVPKDKAGRLVVAVVAPGQPTRVLADEPASKAAQARSAATPAAAKQAKPGTAVFIQTVEVGQHGGFFATGSAPPRAVLRLYLNNSPVATVAADPGGHWSLRVEKGLQPGAYAVRADEIDRAKGTVVARAEAPFEFAGFGKSARETGASASLASGAGGAAAAPGSQKAANDAANAILTALPTVEVVRGDNLWRISRKIFGRGIRYTLIYEANANQIRDRNLIYPGQIFVVPKS